jgi:competence protein ComEC
MAGVVTLGELLGRRGQALVSLAAVSIAMTAWNPLLLVGVSYQLSFAATLALILVEPCLARWTQEHLARRGGARRMRRGVSELLDLTVATVAAQLLTLPLIWHHFGQVSLLSLPANVLVLPAQPPAMALGALRRGWASSGPLPAGGRLAGLAVAALQHRGGAGHGGRALGEPERRAAPDGGHDRPLPGHRRLPGARRRPRRRRAAPAAGGPSHRQCTLSAATLALGRRIPGGRPDLGGPGRPA